MSRSKNAFKNILFSILSALVTFILTLINRKILLNFLGSEMLGYESLFANVFSVLSLTEMGAGTIISYKLFKSVSEKNVKETNSLISIYKYLYRIIAAVVAFLGIILFFFLQYMVKDYTASFSFIQKIYLIQLSATVATYFLTYKRMLFIADQKEYIITKIDIIINFIFQILKICIIAFWQNYIIYLIISVGKAIIVNIIVHIKSRKFYPSYEYIRVNKDDFIKRGIFKDMFNFLSQKISSVIYYNTDNILISALLGVSVVGIYSNYYLIKNQIFHLTTKLFNPIQASIGNFINDPNKRNEGEFLFESLDIISFSFAFVFSCSLYNLLQPFILLWYGQSYLLSNFIVILIVLNAYIETLREIPYYFRSAFGQYEVDKKYVRFGAVSNVLLTICLGKVIGLAGILIGTVVGMIFLWHSVIYFIHKVYLKKSCLFYYLKHLKWGMTAIIGIFISSVLCKNFSVSILGLFIRGVISIIIPLVIILSVFIKTEYFKYFRVLFKNIINK